MSDEYRGGHRGRRGTPLSDLDPELTEISRRVIGCAIEVHKGLGPGYEREVYVNALKGELERNDIGYAIDTTFDVEYEGEKVGQTTADMYAGERFLLSLIARPGEIGSFERSRLRAQLRAADLELGLVINFAERRLKDGLVRVLNPDKLNANRDDSHDHDESDED
jgi:GxxExxY protein